MFSTEQEETVVTKKQLDPVIVLSINQPTAELPQISFLIQQKEGKRKHFTVS